MNFTDEQRLIVTMLGEIGQHLGIKNGLDYGLIAKSAAWHDDWAITWAHDAIFPGSATPAHVRHVVDVLDMWDFIENAYARLQPADQAKVQAAWYGQAPELSGFDGNNESEYYHAAKVLIDDLNRFQHFSGRDLNSHAPSIDRHQRQLEVFLPIRQNIHMGAMTADQIIAVLKA